MAESPENAGLQWLPLPAHPDPSLPADLDRLIQEAWRRIDEFMHERPPGLAERFVAADFDQFHQILSSAPFHPVNRGATFTEWGSGFGVSCLIATRLGWRSEGWEIEDSLVEAAQNLSLIHI